MTKLIVNQVYSPPELPQYLKEVCDLKPIVGTPTDDELIGIHSVIQVASKTVEIRGLGDSVLLARLSEHLFNAQMARHRSAYLDVVLPEHTTYTPQTLPTHVPVHLEPVSGVPSEEEVIKVQDALRSYQQFSNVPSMFNPHVNVQLSQYLFDIQMARYTQRARQSYAVRHENPSPIAIEPVADLAELSNAATNNVGTGASVSQLLGPGQAVQDGCIHDAIENSNRLAEQANKLTERANVLIEQSNELIQRSNKLSEQPNQLSEKFIEIFERINDHFERSNDLVGGLIKPTETIGDVLKTINRVLVRIQHAIVRVS
ncbi:unnamed protein product [Rhizoctonia solani]|uniref:Laminin domain protein n=1 Tax=Rhizoctonia solani TaxID=456999 RepID=A0A8H3G859_9AGAM|nr:unnamed protein product [Rhizoctonia solani]